MLHPRWILHAYHVLQPDKQLDFFACNENYTHLVPRQLTLDAAADRTLCGSLLPAQPVWRNLEVFMLKDERFCSACRRLLEQHRCLKDTPNEYQLWR